MRRSDSYIDKITPALQYVGVPVVYSCPHFVLLKLLVIIIMDQFRPVQRSSDQFRPVQRSLDQFRPVIILVQTRPDQFGPVRTSSDQLTDGKLNYLRLHARGAALVSSAILVVADVNPFLWPSIWSSFLICRGGWLCGGGGGGWRGFLADSEDPLVLVTASIYPLSSIDLHADTGFVSGVSWCPDFKLGVGLAAIRIEPLVDALIAEV